SVTGIPGGFVTQLQTLDLNSGHVAIHTFLTEPTGGGCNPPSAQATTDIEAVVPVDLSLAAAPATVGFTNPFARTIRAAAAPVDEVTAASAPPAAAIAADGISAAVAVYRSIAHSPVTFTATGPATLSTYTADFLANPQRGSAGAVTVSPAFCDAAGSCTFVALVWAPAELDVSPADRAAERFPLVTATVTGTQAESSA